MKAIRIFISSPGDVDVEREKARAVVGQLQKVYADRVKLELVLWEDLPLQPDMSFQEGIDVVLSEPRGVDIAVFILWSRLGTPVGGPSRRADGAPYQSGTEREFDLMLAARNQSGGQRPDVLVYVREDEAAFARKLANLPFAKLQAAIVQMELAKKFIGDRFHDETRANIRAYHTFDKPVGFAERLRVHLRTLVERRMGEAGSPVAQWTDEPYRGLETFEITHAPIFSGRGQEVADVLERLRDAAPRGYKSFVAIVGASGSGKSSLAKAGVAAALLQWNLDDQVHEWRLAICTLSDGEHNQPGNRALENLARALLSQSALPELLAVGIQLADLLHSLERSPTSVIDLALKPAMEKAEAAAGGPVRLLLVLDQLEEIYTDSRIDKRCRDDFLRALSALANCGFISVLATLRSDCFPRAQGDEAFLELLGDRGLFNLLPPKTTALGQIILEPARLAGLKFACHPTTGQTLDARLLEDALRQPDALPLLEFTLRELYQRRSSDRTLTFEAYNELGGLEGVVGRRVEAAFSALPPGVQGAFDEVMWTLVSLDDEGDRGPVRRGASLPPEDDSPRAGLIAALVKERFLTADTSGRRPTVRLAHEALFAAWPRLAQWVSQNRESLRVRRRVEEAARLWDSKARHPDFLLAAGLPLAEAEDLLQRRPTCQYLASPAISQETTNLCLVKQFVGCSGDAVRANERRRNRTAMVATAVFAVLALFSAAGACQAWLGRKQALASAAEARLQSRNAVEAGERLLLNRAQAARVADAPADSIALLAALLRQNPSNAPAAVLLLSLLTDQQLAFPKKRGMSGFGGLFASRSIALAPYVTQFGTNGFQVVTGSSRPKTRGTAHAARLTALDISPRGLLVATGSDDNTARLWSVETAEPATPPLAHAARVSDIQFNSHGTKVVTASWDSNVVVWDAVSGAALHRLSRESRIARALWCANDQRIAFCAGMGRPPQWGEGFGSRVWFWDLRQENQPCPSVQHPGNISAFECSPDGGRLATGGMDGRVVVWDAFTGESIVGLQAHKSWIGSVAFSQDGLWLLTTSGNQMRVWDAVTGKPVSGVIQEPVGDIQFARFGMNGDLLSFSPPHFSVWCLCRRKPVLARRILETNLEVLPTSLVPSSASSRTAVQHPWLAMAGDSRDRSNSLVCVYDLRTGRQAAPPLVFAGSVESISLSPDGGKLLVLPGAARRQPSPPPEIWDWAAGSVVSRPEVESQTRFARLEFVSNDRLVAITENAASNAVFCSQWQVGTGPVWVRLNQMRVGPNAGLWLKAPSTNQVAFGAGIWLSVADFAKSTATTFWSPRCGSKYCSAYIEATCFQARQPWAVSFHDCMDRDSAVCQVWTIGPDAEVFLQITNAAKPILVNRDGSLLATGTSLGGIQVWDVNARKAVSLLDLGGGVARARFLPDGNTLFLKSSTGELSRWDARTGHLLAVHAASPHSSTRAATDELICYSPDGREVLCIENDPLEVLNWTLPITGVPVPDWFLSAAEGVVRRRFDSNSGMREFHSENWAKLVLAATNALSIDCYTEWANWLEPEDMAARRLSPWSGDTIKDHVENCITSGDQTSLREALWLLPDSPKALVHLARLTLADREYVWLGADQARRSTAKLLANQARAHAKADAETKALAEEVLTAIEGSPTTNHGMDQERTLQE